MEEPGNIINDIMSGAFKNFNKTMAKIEADKMIKYLKSDNFRLFNVIDAKYNDKTGQIEVEAQVKSKIHNIEIDINLSL